jgi:hypothetical protein
MDFLVFHNSYPFLNVLLLRYLVLMTDHFYDYLQAGPAGSKRQNPALTPGLIPIPQRTQRMIALFVLLPAFIFFSIHNALFNFEGSLSTRSYFNF